MAPRVLALLGVLVSALSAQAQHRTLSFTLAPAELDLSIAAGTEVKAPLTVSNGSAEAMRFHAAPRDISDPALSVRVVVEPTDFAVDPGKPIILRVTVTIPKDARGGRYAGILVSGVPLDFLGTGPTAVPAILAKVLVRVPGTEVVAAGIQSIAARPIEGGAEVRVVFANQGNIHVRARGRLAVLDARGKSELTQSLGEGLLLPSEVRRFEAKVEGLVPGPHVFRAVFDYGADTLSVGTVKLP